MRQTLIPRLQRATETSVQPISLDVQLDVI